MAARRVARAWQVAAPCASFRLHPCANAARIAAQMNQKRQSGTAGAADA